MIFIIYYKFMTILKILKLQLKDIYLDINNKISRFNVIK